LICCAATHAQQYLKDVVNIENYVVGSDHAGGYALEEKLFWGATTPVGITEGDIAKLSLNDPQLRIIYANLIRAAHGTTRIIEPMLQPEMLAALKDLRRRKDSSTPLFLDIMAKNHNTDLEHRVPYIINKIGGIAMVPYVKYFREMLQTRGQEINASANEAMVELFLEHGTQEDIDAMKKLAAKRPFLEPSFQHALEAKRLKPINMQRPTNVEPTVISPGAPATAVFPRPSARDTTTAAVQSQSPFRFVWLVVVIAATIGAVWLLLRRSQP
jgi:hypothetical protein